MNQREKISAVIAAKGEAESIAGVIDQLKIIADEINVVCDTALDPTVEAAKTSGARVFINPYGAGRGRAIRYGIEQAQGDILIFMDADGSHPPEDSLKLIEPILQDKADFVIGSRMLGSSEEFQSSFKDLVQHFGNRCATALVNLLCGSKISDLHYGHRAIRMTLAKQLNLQEPGMTTEAEMFIKCWRKKFRILEIPAYERMRKIGRSHLKFPGIIWDCLKCYLRYALSKEIN